MERVPTHCEDDNNFQASVTHLLVEVQVNLRANKVETIYQTLGKSERTAIDDGSVI